MQNKIPILIIRPQIDAEKTARNWQKSGINAIAAPLSKFTMLDSKLDKENDYQAIIFTSKNAIYALAQKKIIKNFTHLPCFCVGEICAQFAQKEGFENIIIAKGNVKNLIEKLKIYQWQKRSKILYPRARNISLELKSAVRPFGLKIEDYIIYDMQPIDIYHEKIRQYILGGQEIAFALYSKNNAKWLIMLIERLGVQVNFSKIFFICFSENIAKQLSSFSGAKILIAKHVNDEAMKRLALKLTNN